MGQTDGESLHLALRVFVRVLVVVALVAAGAGVTAVTPPAARAADDDHVVYADGETTSLHLTTGGGDYQRQIVDLPPAEGFRDQPWPRFAWSPDATHLAVTYVPSDGRCCALTVYDLDDGGARTLATDALSAPTWSPDGAWLAYGVGGGTMVIVRPDGSDPRTIDVGDIGPIGPSWSAAGTHIAYLVPYYEEGIADLYVIRTDGTERTRFTHGADEPPENRFQGIGSAGTMSWAPDGSRFVYSEWRRGGTVVLYEATPAGTSRLRSDGGDDGDHSPVWSPAGDRIAFVRSGAVMTMRPDGTDIRTVADGFEAIRHLDYAPEADQLLVVADHDDFQQSDAFTVEVATGATSRTTTAGSVYAARFAPVPTKPLAPTVDTTDACPDGQVPEDGFGDVPASHPHEGSIDCAVWWEVVAGRADGTYGPDAAVTRAQMATFLVQTIVESGGSLPDDPPDAFDDDESSVHEASIDRLAAAGLVSGTGERTYDPDGTVTRAQMATFLHNTLTHRRGSAHDSATDYFHDDADSVHQAAINAVADLGVAAGTRRGVYAPQSPITRGQLATFVTRVLEVLIDEGHTQPRSG